MAGMNSPGTGLLRLEDASGAVIQEFAYGDTWYPQTDGEGYSLQIVDPTNFDLDSWRSAPNWQASTTLEGSPGSASGIARQAGDANLDGEFNQLEVHNLSLQRYGFQQCVDAVACLRGNLREQVLAASVLGDYFVL